jgi:hypothetical protein
MEEETKRLWHKEQSERKMIHPIAEGECMILLDVEDDKEFLFRMRAKGHINLHKGKILHTEKIPLGRAGLLSKQFPKFFALILESSQRKEENKEKLL